jgi:DNA-directed RNA polymerase specialized sigma24 family protein/anti-sigma regulatory factor (Ser/Thr protein kinase)
MAGVISAQLLDVSDAELAAAAERGDRPAFGVLYLRHHEAGWRMACAATGFTADAEIALVDGFAATFDELPAAIGPDLPFRRLLLRAVRRCAIDRLRGSGRTVQPPPPGFDQSQFLPDGDGRWEEAERRLLVDALRLIPEQWRSALWLDAIENLTPPETATVVGLDLTMIAEVCRLAWLEVADLYLGELARLAPDEGCADACHRVEDPRRGLIGVVPPVPLLGGEAQRRWLAAGRRAGAGGRTAVVPTDEVRRARTTFDPVAASVPAARRFVEAVLVQWETTELLEVARLLTSELVTNAVVHARSPIEVLLSLGDSGLRVEVHDCRATLPDEAAGPPDSDRGRGLRVVDSLAHEWGALSDGTRKLVWFELAPPTPDLSPI